MPLVTDIKKQQRTKLRFNVYLDGKYVFALTDLELSVSGLRIGQELSEREVAEFQFQAERDSIYGKAVRFISVRPRSRREVEDYLGRKAAPLEAARAVIARLEQIGLINDREFAAVWVANRRLLRPRSRRQLEQELAAKGVARADVEAALTEVGQEVEFSSLVEVAKKKARLPQYRAPEKLMGYLARQGYQYDVIKKALEIAYERSDD
jgi:regulatory protein